MTSRYETSCLKGQRELEAPPANLSNHLSNDSAQILAENNLQG